MDSRNDIPPGGEPASGGASPMPAPAGPPPWGYLATVAWAVLALFVSSVAAVAGGVWWFGFNEMLRLIEGLSSQYDGAFVSVTAILSTPVQIAVVFLAIRLKRWPIGAYLGFVLPRRREAALAFFLVAVVVAAIEIATTLLGRDIVTPFQVETYRTAMASGWLIGLLVVVVVLAPLSEEILFRGFVYRGFVRRPADAPIAIAVISLAWMMLHLQYDWRDLPQIFIIGLVLGWIRWSTGSTILTIALHAILNAWATVETAIRVEWMAK